MSKVPVLLVFKAIDNASRGIRGVTASMEKLNAQTAKAGKKINDPTENVKKVQSKLKNMSAAAIATGAALSAAITLPVTAAGASFVRSAADFELGMADLQGRTRANKEEFKLLSDEARNIGVATGLGFRGAIEGMTALGKAGLNTEQILKSTKTAMFLSKAEGIGTEQAAELLTDTANQFKLGFDKIEDVGDILGKASDISSIKIMDLQNSLKYAAPMANNLGIELTDLAAAVATLGSLGIKGETGGTALRSFFTTLSGDARKIGILKDKGITGDMLFKDGDVNKMRPIKEVLEALSPIINDSIASTKIFGKEFGSVIQILGKNLPKLQEAEDKMLGKNGQKGRQGQLQFLAGLKMNTFWGQVDKLKAAWDDIGAAMAQDGTLDSFTSFVKSITNLVVAFNKMSPASKKFIAALAVIAAAIGPIVIGLGTLGFAISGIKTLALGLKMGVGPMIGMFGLWALAIGSILLPLGILISRWGDFGLGFQKITKDIKFWFTDLFDFTNMSIDKMIDKLIKLVSWLPKLGLEVVTNTLKYFGVMDSNIVAQNKRASAAGGVVIPFRRPEELVRASGGSDTNIKLDISGAPDGSILQTSGTGARNSNLEIGINGNTSPNRGQINVRVPGRK